MPFLRVERGSCPGQLLEVNGERVVIGRHPSCDIVLDDAAVSRQHAQISESHGVYFLRDLRSRNKTYLNGEEVESSNELRAGDLIQLCDLKLRFLLEMPESAGISDTLPEPLPPAVDVGKTRKPVVPPTQDLDPDHLDGRDSNDGEPEESREQGSSILGRITLQEASSSLLSIKPEQKLRAVLDIGHALAKSLDLDEVLGRMLDGLFNIFPQADHGVVLLQEPNKQKLHLSASKSRHSGLLQGVEANGPGTLAGVSMTAVKRALKTHEALLSADVITDARFSGSDSLASLSIRSIVCVPLRTHGGEVVGVVQLDSSDASRPFSKDDLDTLASVGGQAALAIENARLHAEVLAQRDMRRELDFAMQVQLGFLPSHPPDLPGYEFFDHYEAAFRVGGDYFDYVDFPDGRVAVAVGDVAGKGVPAALLMARLFSSARYQLLARPSPSEALAALNSEIARSALGHRFITVLFALIHPREHTITVANAGHMAPLIRSSDGKVEVFGQAESGMPIGIAPDQTFVEVTRPLHPGDLVLMYTDGVTEAMNNQSDLYGRKRLTKQLAASPPPIREVIEMLVDDVARFSGDRNQRDDVCLVGLRRLPEKSGSP